MQLVLAAGALIVLAVVAMRFGVDARERSHNGWFAGRENTPEDTGTAYIALGGCPSLPDASINGLFSASPISRRGATYD
jgi:hypothetical protein